MLGHWEEAYKDFCKAQISDFDEDVQTWCKEVEANVNDLIDKSCFSHEHLPFALGQKSYRAQA